MAKYKGQNALFQQLCERSINPAGSWIGSPGPERLEAVSGNQDTRTPTWYPASAMHPVRTGYGYVQPGGLRPAGTSYIPSVIPTAGPDVLYTQV